MITIQSRGFTLTPAIKRRVMQRVGLILGHTSHPVRNVDVCLSDINGPRGGVDKKCHVHIRLNGYPSVIVDDIQHDLYYAIDRAASRASRALHRRLSDKKLSRERKVRAPLHRSVHYVPYGRTDSF